MSLRVWLPLNGDIKNYGASDLVFSNNGVTSNASGKIGSCYYSPDYSSYSLISNKILTLGNKQSMFCWVKFVNLTSSSSLGGAMVGQHRYPSNTGMGLTFKYVSSTTGYLSINTGTGSGRTYNTYCSSTLLQANTWYHVGYTYDGSTVKLYVNGVLDGTHNVGTLSNPADYVHVFAWSFSSSSGTDIYGGYHLYGYLNDVRIYDNVVSYDEVKEISKALVAYYPLNNLTVYSNLIKNSTYTIYNNYGVPASLTALNETLNGCQVYRLSMTPTSGNISSFRSDLWSHGIYGFGRTFSANTKYCFWMYYRPVTYSDTVVGGTASNIGGWTEIPHKYVSNGWYVAGQYRDGSVTSDKSDNIFFSMYSPSAAVDTPFVVDFACPSLVIGTTEIQDVGDYQENNLGKVIDCSGYNRTGTTTSFTCPYLTKDSPRGSKSCHFTTNAKNLTLNSSFLPTFTTGSVSWWAKIVTNGSEGTLPFTGQSSYYYIAASSRWTGAFYNYNTSAASGYSIKYYVDGVEDNTPPGADGKWHHYVVSGVNMSLWTELWLNNYVNSPSWNASDIYYSDIKFYNTVLSADDVSKEYHTYASIYSNQTLKACEFIEPISANLLEPTNTTLTRKTWGYGLSAYTQSNCNVTLTDNGYRIYRDPNLTYSGNGSVMWGGLVIKPYDVYGRDMLIKGHTYILKFHVKGQSSNGSEFYWTNQCGWGGGGLEPSPDNVSYQMTPSNFQGEMECFYKWTINDDVWKVCTTSYSGFTAGNTYLSYRDFKYGFNYGDTGPLGTDLYITNIRMYDITAGNIPVKISTKGVCYGNLIEENFDKVSVFPDGEIYCREFIEV